MSKRINFAEADPEIYKTMLGLEKYVAATDIDPITKELIKIRASQINGCSYCVDKHTKDARKLGETEQRLYTVAMWKDTPFFSEEEQTILAMTEEITLISAHGLSDETYNKAIALFGDKKFAQIMMAIITINAWNRIGVSTHLMPA